MSPEYAMDGLFSTKSDVFSFGVLVLEIVSGKKNRGFYYASNQLNLIGHVSGSNTLLILFTCTFTLSCVIHIINNFYFRYGTYGKKAML